MFTSNTDYSAYPTLAPISRKDREVLYKKPLSEKDILEKFKEIQENMQEIERDRVNLRSRVSILENEIKVLNNRIELLSEKSITSKQSDNADNSDNNEVIQTKPGLKIGDEYTLGIYKKEKIQWKVLEVKDGKALLLSEKALDCRPYYKKGKNITWAESDLRKWLNQEFMDQAFTIDEKNQIITTLVENQDNDSLLNGGIFLPPRGENTQDQLFLLSIEEAKKYFQSNEERRCYPTNFAKKQRAYVDSGLGFCWWWLRSPGYSANKAVCVNSDGSINEGGYIVRHGSVAVRPAMWINLR